jgi:uncharacterized protein (DUF2336 family)
MEGNGKIAGDVHLAGTPNCTLVTDLERAISSGSMARCVGMLTLITDLFVGSAECFSDEAIYLFDDLMSRLVLPIDGPARSMLAQRLAPLGKAPINVTRLLANDDDITVASPILACSDSIDEASLLHTAQTKDQRHLRVIARRKSIPESVVDVLVERGDGEVLRILADNCGAKLSEKAFAQLINRCANDDTLANSVGSRPDIPHHRFQQLLATASELVRLKFVEVNLPVKIEFGCVEPHFVFASGGEPLLAA